MSEDITDEKVFPLDMYYDADWRPVETKAEAVWIDRYTISKKEGLKITTISNSKEEDDDEKE